MLFQERKETVYGKDQRNRIDRNGKKMCIWEKVKKSPKTRERICSLKSLFCLFAPKNRRREKLPGKVSLCASLKKASLTVETALVLPLFFLGMVTLISFMDIYKVQTEHLAKLCENTKKAGMYAYGTDQTEIILPDVYCYQPVGGLLALPRIWMSNTVKVHAWTGEESSPFQDASGEDEEMVYVTESGSVYHRKADCTYLDLSVSAVSGNRVGTMRNSSGEKYAACETCSRNQTPGSYVYVTKTGNRYHNLESCSGLKRTVRMVKHSHTGNLKACSRCG